ncbi:uncharacterized protein LOC143302214 [Babylonia areolata]|uniref:uncharacterized protein LOC143302214 n=1 Tax=Babylonia areolata TaxID=304850 RepID=UPI003FD119F8
MNIRSVTLFSFVCLTAAPLLTSSAGILGHAGKMGLQRGPPEPRPTPGGNTKPQPGNMTAEMCSPPCGAGECCLLRPGASAPVCKPLVMSGRECDWHHCSYGEQSASNIKAVFGNRCPCSHMCCLRISREGEPFKGLCTSF